MTDTDLIQQYLSGNIHSFNTLVWRWDKRIYNFVYRHIGETETAKDICQKTFIKTYKELKRLRDPDKFSSWIYRVALNLCRDEFKRKKARPKYYIDDLLTFENSDNANDRLHDQQSQTPDEAFHIQQLGDILKQALQVIPEEQRVVIIMKQYQGLKFTEIADILKQPVNTIKSRLYYGLKALRTVLEKSNLNKEVLFNEM